jgi:hypothetical protein
VKGGSDNRVARIVVYNLAWWIVRRRLRRRRRKLIALAVVGLVLAGGVALGARSRSE